MVDVFDLPIEVEAKGGEETRDVLVQYQKGNVRCFSKFTFLL